jgi:hypothetical protein
MVFLSEKNKKTVFFWMCLALIVAVYFFPFLTNYKQAASSSVHDDNIFAYSMILRNIDFFGNDFFKLSYPYYLYGSLINCGSIWLNRFLHIPLGLTYNVLCFFQLFAFPIMLLAALKNKLNYFELIALFCFSLLAGHQRWNLANYGPHEMVYAASVALPILCFGLYLISLKNGWGFAALSLGGLIHPSLALYSILIAFISFLLDSPLARKRDFLFLAIPFLCTVIPPLALLSTEMPHVSKSVLMRALELNSHLTPWSDEGWAFSFPVVVNFTFLAALSLPFWKQLDRPYYKLLLASFIAVLILCGSQLVGHLFAVPKLIQVIGLRSPSMFAALLIPILFLFLNERAAHTKFGIRFLAAFALLHIAAAQPYGLDKMPIIFLGLYLLLEWRAFKLAHKETLALFLSVIFFAWCFAWLFYTPPEPKPYSREFFTALAKEWSFFDYIKMNYLVDQAPRIGLIKKLFVLLGSFIVAFAPKFAGPGKNEKTDLFSKVFLAAFLTVCVCWTAFSNQQDLGSQARKDLHAAQLWAKENTAPGTLFISTETSWRTFSERPLFHPVPALYYVYSGDKRIKDQDDLLIRLLGLQNTYETQTGKMWNTMKVIAYVNKMKHSGNIRRLGKQVGAKFLVEKLPYDLPVLYSNDTYRIYDLS